ncbi:LysR family transcriptional regulator [Pullulanibacillus camelliae]|uniref:LysR family transcriptional regulator n=1 Tax=Pullulanibacillus camelliae TaxID=1707096 RepID=A0A8J2VK40_9BACL|nr:LysR family transcriptional regulator [Pullulanibacillus camelliae]GGE27785.1 LysR family transcriptional regulator [Pullulanibacillus camelliae]
MNLHQLFIFCSVAKNKSFINASRDLNISQPAISQQIKSLEQVLGKKLIERRGKLFQLTHHGETLYEYGVRIFSMVEEAESALEHLGNFQKNILIGTPKIPGTYYLPKVIRKFMEKNPYIHFDVSFEESNAILLDKLIKNQIDIIINYESVILRNDIEVKKIYQDELVLAIPPKHPWANGQLITFEEILTQPFIFYSPKLFIQQILENILSGHKVNVILQLDHFEAVKSCIIQGLGISLIPYSTIESELKQGFIATANCRSFTVPRNLVAIYKDSKVLPNILKEFIATLG